MRNAPCAMIEWKADARAENASLWRLFEAKNRPLLGPIDRKLGIDEPVQTQIDRLGPFEDRRRDVGRQQSEWNDAADISSRQSLGLRNFRDRLDGPIL
jgi:hypothetical protein